MLSSLYIQNYVLIEKLDIRFHEGLSVITGETGAGKSIMLGALGLVLGQRADGKSIRHGADKCVIEAHFDISSYQLQAFFEENDLEYDPVTSIFRRELYASGKSRAFINDSPVSLPVMKELGSRLIDIHSQHQNLLLGDNRFQLRVVDILAKNNDSLETYKKAYTAYQALLKELKRLKETADQNKKEEDFLRFQWEQLAEANLQEEEQEELEREQEMLSHAEEIKLSLFQIQELLNGEDRGGVMLLKEALSVARAMISYYAPAEEIVERLETAYIDLNDLASEADKQKEGIEFNPDRLDWVNDRLNTLYSLQQKHRVSTIGELLALKSDFEGQLKEIDSYDEQIDALEKQKDSSYKELLKQAEALHTRRLAASKQFAEELTAQIALLGIPHARFQVAIEKKAEPGADGMDDVAFFFSAHRAGELMPVAQTASGGEISRLMLCIKAMMAGYTALPAIIFDEVDTGVSGDMADKMGEIMLQLAKNMQVIAITHLPQIASKGRTHYLVYKEDTAEQTNTYIKPLTDEERVRDIARMLSGATLTEASMTNARELLQNS
ncbi:DNA repair protein RecN (Recombination protein N) [Parabacteroides sp. PFB2-10]|uniref:DNA repair protein RecN n=1 Tax=Parabacteroides sp. PFB2-10 TaxID=1742405 RepID=UPI002473C866|nr:DNA repair protein RecN [Parabacteroides sp. PFB2-10]MDH6313620.1 DNA repair protein RecN (Recombination protein N) [Parabacteroides sp. PFB2-10]